MTTITTLQGGTQVFAWEKVLRDVPGVRKVVLGTLDHQKVVAKFFMHHAKGPLHQQTELINHDELVRGGVLTPRVIYADKDAEDHPVIIYECIEQTADSHAVWNSPCADTRLSFLKTVVGILALEHIQGLCQHDLHPSNFIIVHEKCYTLDPASIDVYKGGVPTLACLENLGELCAQIAIPFYEDYRYAVETYCHIRKWSCDEQMLRIIEAWQNNYREKREKKYVEKLFRGCTRILYFQSFFKVIACWREKYTPAMQAMLSNIEAAIKTGAFLKAGNSNTVVKVPVEDYQVVVKRYNLKNTRQRIKRFFGQNKAKKSWMNAGRLFFHHVPTPMPIALVEHKWGPFRRVVYFISEYVEGQTLKTFLKQQNLTKQEKTFIFSEIKSLFKSLQRLRLSHGDMKATNFLVTKNSVMMTDMDAMQRHTSLRTFKKAQARDIKRFLKNFHGNAEYVEAFTEVLKDVVQ